VSGSKFEHGQLLRTDNETFRINTMSTYSVIDELRGGLTGDFICYPGLVSLIKQDWRWLWASNPPQFVKVMRNLTFG